MDQERRPSGVPGGSPTVTRLFTVRIWSESTAAGVQHRGEVRDTTTGAHRGFARWGDLAAFLDEQLGVSPTTPKEH